LLIQEMAPPFRIKATLMVTAGKFWGCQRPKPNFPVSADSILTDRLDGVLAVIYLIFNEGYSASGGDRLTRGDLSREAIRLGRVLADLMPDGPEVLGWLALMLLQDSRRDARQSPGGLRAVLLGEQDRSTWDHEEAADGVFLVDRALG
jgi:RNA polymerase sigma-70 factor (ECF subfamily)